MFAMLSCVCQLVPAAGELLKQFLVECLALVERSHRHEHVSADELVHDLAVGTQALERHLAVAVVAAQLNLQDTSVLTILVPVPTNER